MKSKPYTIPTLLTCRYLGADFEEGMQPALFYFSLSAEESLDLAPYNSPAILFADQTKRVFSFTIPGHGEGQNKFHALQYWAEHIAQGDLLLERFFEDVCKSISYLIDQGIVDPKHMATCGLSRGAFVATHIAALEKRISTLLGFAPVTTLQKIDVFKPYAREDAFQARIAPLNLESILEELTHLKHVRFYIGNYDTKVDTDACYSFIRSLSQKVHEKRMRHCHVELRITPRIGHEGHGTYPETFEEGVLWLKKHL